MSTILKSNGSSPINTIFDEIIEPYSQTNTIAATTTTTTSIPTNSGTNTNNMLVKSLSSSSSPSKSSSQNSLSSSVAKDTLCQQQLQSNNEQKNTFLMCFLCNQQLREPKLLNCLHSLCRNCLLNKAASAVANEFSAMSAPSPASINCPKCDQETVITGSNGIDSLEDDYITQNLLEMLAVEEMIMNCSSCKTDAKAVSRCLNCADFLCENCVSAHKYMKVFEDHQVVQIQKKLNNTNSCGSSSSSSSSSSTYSNSSSEPDLLTPIHKPLFCKIHPKENLKFFCNTCQIPICSDCVVSIHQQPSHFYERLSEVQTKNVEELETLVKDTKEKIDECSSEFQVLIQHLAELEEHKEQSKRLIEETYQSYIRIVQTRKNDLLKELEDKHSTKELAIMDLDQTMQGSIDQLLEVVKFTERVLKNGNSIEILSLKSLIVKQMHFLINNLPLIDNVDVNLKFLTDEKRFEKCVQDTFGRFQTQKELKQTYLNNLTSSTSQNESILGMKSLNENNKSNSSTLNQIQNIHKQIELQQQNNFIKQQPMFHSAMMDQEWTMFNATSTTTSSSSSTTTTSTTNNNQFKPTGRYESQKSPSNNNDDWAYKAANKNNTFQQQQQQPRISLSPQSNQNIWLNNNNGNQQLPVKTNNNFSTIPNQQTYRTSNTSLVSKQSVENNMNMLTNASSSLQQHQIFLQQQHQNSRCHTPSQFINQQQQQQQSKNNNNNFLQNELAALNIGTNLQNMNSVGSSSSSSGGGISNQLVVNSLDEYLPFGTGSSSSMAQNFNQLSKLITNQVVGNNNNNNNGNINNIGLTDLAALNMNFNELTLTNQQNNNFPLIASDANSNSSQSPTLGPIGSGSGSSGSTNQFVGNGNLNPPVRQHGKMANMQIRNKFGQLGPGKSQFNSPHGFALGIDEEIIVADTNNHRIAVFDKNGEFKYSFGSPGREEGQFWYPRKVAVMRESGKFVVCDRGNERSRMQIFNRSGHFVRKVGIRYIDIVAGLAISQQSEIIAVDSVSPTVFRISEAGDLIKWFDCSDHMREPSDIAISGNEYFVCDFKGHCIVVFHEDGTFMRKIGGENITNFPNGIDVSDAGDVVVGDSHGNRFHIAVFSREGILLTEFECPYVKVSRCCGLKITSEGYVVTLAKNNHHVLVLNTLYVS